MEGSIMGKIRHGCATTKQAIRATIQRSQATTAALSRELAILPKMENRNHANRTCQRMINYVLDNHGLKLDQDGQPRTTYSLRHYALQTRLNKSGGKVNIYDLARNAGTSVNQLERFYLKRMKVSQKQRERLNRFDSTE
jgi:hypothetical protein